MPLVPAVCTQCGGKLTVDSNCKTVTCPFCCTEFIAETAINNYSTTNVTNIENLHADVVQIANENSKENKLKSADTFIKLEEYGKAERIFIELTNTFPHDYRGWWGLIRAKTLNFSDFDISETKYNELYSRYKKMIAVGENASVEKFEQTFLAYMEKCKKNISSGYETRKAALKQVSEKILQLDKENDNKINTITSELERKKAPILKRIESHDKKEEITDKIGFIVTCILICVAIVVLIALFIGEESMFKRIGIVFMYPLIFACIIGLIFCLYNAFVAVPIKAVNDKKRRVLLSEINKLEAVHNEALKNIRVTYGKEKAELESEKEKILKTIEHYR